MKTVRSEIKRKIVYLVGMLALCLLLTNDADARINQRALFLQQTPVDGGQISPGSGVHLYATNQTLTISATPAAGYQFVHWLGDVGDPTAATTTVTLDAPKIIIAIFERTRFELPVSIEAGAPNYTKPANQLIARGTGYSNGGSVRAPSAARVPKDISPPSEPENDDLPVPEDGLPKPIPEPATSVLLMLGAAKLLTRKRKHGTETRSRI